MITTTSLLQSQAPGLLRNSVDQRIVKIRPMSTPIDQLSRCGSARQASAMTVDYYTVDTKATETTSTQACGGKTGTRRSDDIYTHRLQTADNSIFEVSETLLVPEVPSKTDGDASESPLVLYVYASVDNGGGIEVAPVNSARDASGGIFMPEIPAGSRIIRMGRAATELDVQTGQFSVVPRKSDNYCQIFKMQIEQSTLAKIANKETGWSFSDQEEAAVIDMRLGMEKNFLFGAKSRMFNPAKNEQVYTTGGIWFQARKEHSLNLSTLTESDLIELCSDAFTGNSGNRRKIFICGTGMMEELSKITLNRCVRAESTTVKWGIEFNEIRTNFGRLFIVHSEIFDQCGHSDDGFIIDPDYLTKYSHLPFRAESLDLRRSGQRNTDVVVLTEASCLVLRHPTAHMRVIGRRQ